MKYLGYILIALAVLLLVTVISAFLWGLFLMVVFAFLHATDAAIPAFGYWTSVGFGLIAAAISTSGTLSVSRNRV